MSSHLKLFLVVVGIHAILIATVSSKSIPGIQQVATTLVNGSSPQVNFRLIGTVDGKSYYVDDSVARTWAQASLLCSQANMELGSIENGREWDFLQSRNEIRLSATWTGGREYLTMMGWDHEAPVNPAVIKIFSGGVEEGGRCLALYSVLGMAIFPCDLGMGTLCQS